MMISDEQARAAAEYLRQPHSSKPQSCASVPEDLLRRAYEVASAAPDTRSDRMDEARARLASHVDSADVAAKMISRIVSDSLR